MKKGLKQLISIFRRNKEAKATSPAVETKPFSVTLVKRATGPHSKRGIHSTTETIDSVTGMRNSSVAPYVIFNFADGTQLSIHHDRLLEVRSHVQK